MATKRIGILTGGGDVPGLNSVIKAVVYRGREVDFEITGIRRGWEGLTHVNLEDPQSRARYILPLNPANTRTIDRTGGTFLHTSRTNPAKMKAVHSSSALGVNVFQYWQRIREVPLIAAACGFSCKTDILPDTIEFEAKFAIHRAFLRGPNIDVLMHSEGGQTQVFAVEC